MAINKPFFSVLMPTNNNRAHLLSLAIKSVLQQTFTDFEIIISNGGSTDNTNEVVKSFNDPRIKYFEAKKRLSMSDNYQNAYDHAQGEYIAFLSDDDAYTPLLLEKTSRIINEKKAEIVGFRSSLYFHNQTTHYENNIPANSLWIEPFTSQVNEFSRIQSIKTVFHYHDLLSYGWNDGFIVPYLNNAVYQRKIFSRIAETTPKLFASVPLDMYLAAAVFYVTDTYYCLDEPLHLWSSWENNATASPQTNSNIIEHYQKLLKGETLQYTPVKFTSRYNCGINAILQAKNDFDPDGVLASVEWWCYFAGIYNKDFTYLKKGGVNITEGLREFKKALSQQPGQVQKKVRGETNKVLAKQLLSSYMPFVVKQLRQFKNNKTGQVKIISGQQNKFNDVLEAANFLSGNY